MLYFTLLVISFAHLASPFKEDGQHISLRLTDQYSNNLTIYNLSPNSMEVSWSCPKPFQDFHPEYEVTIKPLLASYRIVKNVRRDECHLYTDNLEPDTVYQVFVTSIYGRIRRRSSSLIFRTPLEESQEFIDEDEDFEDYDSNVLWDSDPRPYQHGSNRVPQVRFVEVSLVGMALVLWAGAIILFFHRWGKIRMLLPYQPDFREKQHDCTNCSKNPHQCHQCPNTLRSITISPEFLRSGNPTTSARLAAGSFIAVQPLIHTPSYYCGEVKSPRPLASNRRKTSATLCRAQWIAARPRNHSVTEAAPKKPLIQMYRRSRSEEYIPTLNATMEDEENEDQY